MPEQNISQYISIFIVCKQSQQHAAFVSYVAEPPRITTHPQEVKDAVPGKLVTFSIQATGTQPLNYQWECKKGDRNGSNVERIAGASSSTLIISSVQKSNEGSYHCVVSNCAGNQTSEPAKLNIGKIQIIICSAWCSMTRCHRNVYIVIHLAEPPRITVQPQELKGAVPGKPVIFTVRPSH